MLLRSSRVLIAAAALGLAGGAYAIYPSPPAELTSTVSAFEHSSTSAPHWSELLGDVPVAVRKKLAKLFPEGTLLDRGRDRDDGYYWFEIRRGGTVWDVEITDDGKLKKKVVDRD